MAKLGYDAALLPGEELMYKIQGVYDISQHLSTVGTLYITSFQTFFVDEARGQLKDIIPHGCVSSLKKYKNQNTNNVPLTDKLQYLEVRCKDLRVLKYILPTSSRPAEVKRYLEHACLPDNCLDICAFAYLPKLAAFDQGWTVYNALEEYRRIGLIAGEGEPGTGWRVTEFNAKFAASPTYPEIFVVPETISDKTLEKAAEFRSKARIPVCVWRHRTSGASISRCSQPMVGIGRRSEEDEELFKQIQRANKNGKRKTLYIIDARPKVNAAACTLSGGGTEIVGNYSDANVVLEYCGIANIHVVREAFKRLGKVCRGWDARKSKWSDVTHTHWLDHISSILVAACRMVTYVEDKCSVLVHCTDGWDRTSQLCALAELMMDPFYRTIRGFIVLICKEFISFGHKFNTRNGNISYQPKSQCAPIFIQFMDCVWQLTRQFPTSFEFSENLLLLITTHLYSHLFGTFLCDNDCERANISLHTQSSSLWGLLLFPPPSLAPHLLNPMYAPHPGTLHGNGQANSMQLWRGYYQRWMDEGKKEDGKKGESKKEEAAKEENGGKANGLKHSGGAQNGGTNYNASLYEVALIPFLDKLTLSERETIGKELVAWLAAADGQTRERLRVVVTPRIIRPPEPKEKDKEGQLSTVRSASHSKGAKGTNATMSEDEGDDEEEEGENGRVIRRGRSFSAVFAKVTGRSTVRDKGRTKDEKEDKEEKEETHKGKTKEEKEENHNTTSSSSNPPNPSSNTSSLSSSSNPAPSSHDSPQRVIGGKKPSSPFPSSSASSLSISSPSRTHLKNNSS